MCISKRNYSHYRMGHFLPIECSILMTGNEERFRQKGETLMKLKVLIADGSEFFAQKLARALVRTGKYDVVGIALDGKQAINLIKEHKPDVLFLDLILARFDGLTVLDLTNDVIPKPVVIASSMFISDYVKASCKRLGVKFLLRKPCSVRKILRCIKQAEERKTLASTETA